MRSLLKGKYTQIPQMHFSKNINPNDIFSIATPTTYTSVSTNVTMPKEAIIYDKLSKGVKTINTDDRKIITKHLNKKIITKHLKIITKYFKNITKYVPILEYVPWINKWL